MTGIDVPADLLAEVEALKAQMVDGDADRRGLHFLSWLVPWWSVSGPLVQSEE